MKLRLRDTRQFVEARLQDLHSMFGGEPRLVRAAIAQHVPKITLKPKGEIYIASGVWDWLGSTWIACNSHKKHETSGDSRNAAVRMVPGARIELATPAFSGRRSTSELPRHKWEC
jgi:hypothetical protein